jgi:hypothetical protein
VASDYGGAYGGQPWHGAQPPYPGQPGHGGPAPRWEPSQAPGARGPKGPNSDAQHPGSRYRGPAAPDPGPPALGAASPGAAEQGGAARDPGDPARRLRVHTVAIAVLAVGALGLACSLAGAVNQKLPRKFTATQRQQLTDWEYGQRWRTLPAGTIFPAAVSYTAPSALDDDPSLSLSAHRVGIAGQATCAAAADPAAAAVLDRDGCSAVLRATYVDGTDSYVVTVGAAVLPGSAAASAAAAAITGEASSDGLGPAVRTVQFSGTQAAVFTNARRQLSGAVSAGTYVILYTVGYTDDRPREPVSGDSYADGEMTSAGAGVAHAVQSVLGAPVRSPGCPGTPGC